MIALYLTLPYVRLFSHMKRFGECAILGCNVHPCFPTRADISS